MSTALRLALFVLSGVIADAANACEKWEYAKLKDATKAELTKEYCFAEKIAEIDKEIVASNRKLIADFQPYGASLTDSDRHQTSLKKSQDDLYACLQQMDDTGSMLQKKYKVKNPVCKK